MAKGTRGRRSASRRYRLSPYPLPSHADAFHMNCSKIFKKDWEDATCSVCMECPHNAVLLLCSSHEKGCRPYMCGTSFRHSNCLDQYKKAYAKVTSCNHNMLHNSLGSQFIDENSEPMELACPLCRGQVKGWTVVEPAREHLNAKTRSCMQDNCSFIGTYKELRKHVKSEHPSAKPREVDPALEQNWRGMERERERDDVLSTIRSSMPGAMFFGDYVIEGGNRYGLDSDDEEEFHFDTVRNDGNEATLNQNLMSVFVLMHEASRQHARNSTRLLDRGPFRLSIESLRDDSDQESGNDGNNNTGEGGGNFGTSLAARLGRQGRVVFSRSQRRRSRREGGF